MKTYSFESMVSSTGCFCERALHTSGVSSCGTVQSPHTSYIREHPDHSSRLFPLVREVMVRRTKQYKQLSHADISARAEVYLHGSLTTGMLTGGHWITRRRELVQFILFCADSTQRPIASRAELSELAEAYKEKKRAFDLYREER